jgi:uncharacterized repeat protein (TIGR01451 family)
MSHQGRNGRGGPAAGASPRALALIVGIALWVAGATGQAQNPANDRAPAAPPGVEAAPAAPLLGASPAPPGLAVVGPGGAVGEAAPAAAPALEPGVQVVRFQGPPGLTVEVLAPAPSPVPAGDGGGIITVCLKRGVGYRLRISNIPERPGSVLFPVIEVVGHLHRPDDIPPAKYPIRVIFSEDDLYDAVDRARLVTKVVYLEDPDQAVPFRMHKDEIPVLTLSPTELPLQVASALGRPVAIVRLGGRKPTNEEIQGGSAGDVGLDWAASIGSGPCPFLSSSGARCALPCGPVCVPSPPPARPSLPRDEYLCDGGDRGVQAASGPSGNVGGIEPRDTVVGFDIGLKEQSRKRVLPTNVVCVYAPRFSEVRVNTGTNENVDIQWTRTDKVLAKHSQTSSSAVSKRLVQNQAAELARARARAAGLRGRLWADEESNNRSPSGFSGSALVAVNLQKQSAELARNRQKPVQLKNRLRLDGIKSTEGPVVAGIVEGASEAVMVWAPHAMTGVETPPDRPGLAVIKRVSPVEAEPGDTLTYVITYRNMGNTPIRAVSIVDSLLPRLEYVKGTSRGPAGTRFTTAINPVGSTELRWELPGVLAPGVQGEVSFQAIVR